MPSQPSATRPSGRGCECVRGRACPPTGGGARCHLRPGSQNNKHLPGSHRPHGELTTCSHSRENKRGAGNGPPHPASQRQGVRRPVPAGGDAQGTRAPYPGLRLLRAVLRAPRGAATLLPGGPGAQPGSHARQRWLAGATGKFTQAPSPPCLRRVCTSPCPTAKR